MKNNGSLNRIYRLVWSHVLNSWVAVAESARGTGKGSSNKLIAAALSLSSVLAHAGPQGGVVVSGVGSIAKSGATTTINQSSQNLSLTWQSFNVGKQDIVNFVQPSATAVAINRIYDTNGSQILGQINANGQVYLINPNGILFGQGAQVNVGALVASTLDVSDDSLSSTTRVFSGNGTGSVVNQGTINAAGSGSGGGYVAMLGNTVINQGTITAPQGTVALGAASETTLTFEGSNLIGMQIDQGVLDSLAENSGLIRADGGIVMMSAGARNELLASVVNNTGVLEARTVESHEGTITLLAGMSAGTVQVGGTLDASATSGGNGGFIETSAANVKFAEDANITTAATSGETGTWLIDPTNFTIDAGSGTRTGSGMGAEALSNALLTNNVEIETIGAGSELGDINVNADVTWSTNKLTLTAHNDININAVMTANDNASLNLQPGSNGGSGNVITGRNPDGSFKGRVDFFEADGLTARSGTGFLTIGENNYSVIGSAAALRAMVAGTNYALGGNIDLALAAFAPIGSFTSTFDGLGHTISNLAITGGASTGLFADVSGATIQNVGLVNGTVTGAASTGALVGNMASSTINNSYAQNINVRGAAGTGGLVGTIVGTGISNINTSYTTGTVDGAAGTGGLVGSSASPGNISNSYATGNVSGHDAGGAGTGGLVGSLAGSGNISNSYAMGKVMNTGTATGGLVGSTANSGSITNSCAAGDVQGDGAGTGGLVGSSAASGDIINSYATGNVMSVAAGTGGLVGSNTSGAIFQSFASGNVNGGGAGTGGLVGSNTEGTISESFAVGNVSGSGYSIAAPESSDTAATVGASTGGLVGSNSGTIRNTYAAGTVEGFAAGVGGLVGSGAGTVVNSYSSGTVTNGEGETAVGGGQVLASDFGDAWKTGIITGNPLLKNINKTITLTGGSVSKQYDGLAYAGTAPSLSASCCTNNPGFMTVTLSTLGQVNAGVYSIAPTVVLKNTALTSYFTVTPVTLTVTPKVLTATATVANRAYDGTTSADASLFLDGFVGSETLTATNTASFNSKNVVDANTVTVDSVTLANGTNGGLASNYTLADGQTVAANITAKDITLAGVTADSRAYNGNTDATLGGTATGLVDGESLTLSGQFASKDAASNIAVTVLTADAADGSGLASNYSLAAGQTVTATIDQAVLTATATVANRAYDGTTSADASLFLDGFVGSETLTATNTASFNSKNVVDANTVTVDSVTLANGTNGGLASNYTLADGQTVAANITAKDITLAGVTADSRAYNGNTDATLGGTATGLVDGESLTLSGQFASKDAASNIAVTVLTADAADGSGLASNYFISPESQTVVANIGIPTITPETPTAPLDISNGTTLEALNSAALTAASMITIPRVNPTVGELTANTSTTTDTTENGVNVVTNQLDDGSRTLEIINDGMKPSSREVDTQVSDAASPNTAIAAGG